MIYTYVATLLSFDLEQKAGISGSSAEREKNGLPGGRHRAIPLRFFPGVTCRDNPTYGDFLFRHDPTLGLPELPCRSSTLLWLRGGNVTRKNPCMDPHPAYCSELACDCGKSALSVMLSRRSVAGPKTVYGPCAFVHDQKSVVCQDETHII